MNTKKKKCLFMFLGGDGGKDYDTKQTAKRIISH